MLIVNTDLDRQIENACVFFISHNWFTIYTAATNVV